MILLKTIIGTVISIVALTLALKLAGIIISVAFFAFWLIKIVFVLGFLALIAWLLYRLFSPKEA